MTDAIAGLRSCAYYTRTAKHDQKICSHSGINSMLWLTGIISSWSSGLLSDSSGAEFKEYRAQGTVAGWQPKEDHPGCVVRDMGVWDGSCACCLALEIPKCSWAIYLPVETMLGISFSSQCFSFKIIFPKSFAKQFVVYLEENIGWNETFHYHILLAPLTFY